MDRKEKAFVIAAIQIKSEDEKKKMAYSAAKMKEVVDGIDL